MTVSGRILAAGGAPLAKAEVRLCKNERSFAPVEYAARTSADGRFAFENVEPGQYTLDAERSGYVPGAFGRSIYAMGWTPLTVAPDRSLDEIEMTLIPQAVIKGRVLDEDGEPFENVRVMLLQETRVGPAVQLAPRPGRVQVTNDEGEFRIPAVAPGRYLLQASLDRDRRGVRGRLVRSDPESAYPDLFYPDVRDAAEAQYIDVAMGARLDGFELWMKPSRGYKVSGRIEWPEGLRREQCHVHLHPAGRGSISGGGRAVAAGPAGDSFSYTGMLPGRYALTAQGSDERGARHAMLQFEIVDRDLDGLVVRFPEGFPVEGVLRGGDVAGLRFGLSGPTNVSAAPNADGAFRLDHLAPGSYRVHFWEIPAAGYVKSVHYGGVEMTPEAIEIREPARLEIEIGFDSATVEGAVAPPHPGAMVNLWRNGVAVHFAPADQDGRFEIRGVAPGEYLATASEIWRPGPPQTGLSVRAGSGERVSLTVKIE